MDDEARQMLAQKLDHSVGESAGLVLLLTPHVLHSPWVLLEVTEAVKRQSERLIQLIPELHSQHGVRQLELPLVRVGIVRYSLQRWLSAPLPPFAPQFQ